FGLYVLPGLSEDTLHPAGGEGRDEPDMLGHERAGPADLTHHLAAAHRIDPERAPVHRRCRGLEAREENREQHDCASGDSAPHIPAIPRRRRAGNVQVNPRCPMSDADPTRLHWHRSCHVAIGPSTALASTDATIGCN